MLSLFKKIFGRGWEPEPVASESVACPQEFPALDLDGVPSSTIPQNGGSGEFIELSLKTIIDTIPEPLKATLKRSVVSMDRILAPTQLISSKLSQGQVTITFGELKQFAPTDLFSNFTKHDSVTIELPLHEIISALGPSRLPRRAGQKQVEISEMIQPVFGKSEELPSTSEGLGQLAGEPLGGNAEKTAPEIIEVAPGNNSISRKDGSRQNLEIRRSIFNIPRETQPLSQLASASVVAPVICNALESNDSLTPVSPSNEEDCVALPLSAVTTFFPEAARKEFSKADLKNTFLCFPFAELEPALKRGKAAFQLKQLHAWIQPPIALPQALAASDLSVDIPLHVVAPQFMSRRKIGRSNQRQFAAPNTIPQLFQNPSSKSESKSHGLPNGKSNSSAKPHMEEGSHESALKMERNRASISSEPTVSPAHSRETKPENSRLSSSPASIIPWNPSPEMRTPDESKIGSLPANNLGAQKSSPPSNSHRSLGEIFGQPTRQTWTVSEIARRAAQLKGVTGALLVTLDGLLVAAELPSGLAAETLAAFVPQMFSRLAQYAKELKCDEPRHLTFLIENTAVLIFKSGCVYFTLLGKDRETLPMAQLSAIAEALPRPSFTE